MSKFAQKACTLDGRRVSAHPSRQSSMHLKLQNSPVLQPQRAIFALWANALCEVHLFSGHYLAWNFNFSS
ncbi:MAG: hypothetical protein RR085_12475, partial [Clostridia bacterium]